MSTMLPPAKPPTDWFSMWMGWPFLVYEEWLKLLNAPTASPPSQTPPGERFGIAESDTELVLVAEAPEFRRTELNATIGENAVNIRGERHEEAESGELHVSFDRKIVLPTSAKVEEATTSLRDGLVEVRIPKWSGVAELDEPSSADTFPAEAQEMAARLLPEMPIPEPIAIESKASQARRAPRAPSLARRGGAKKRASAKKGPTKKAKRRH